MSKYIEHAKAFRAEVDAIRTERDALKEDNKKKDEEIAQLKKK